MVKFDRLMFKYMKKIFFIFCTVFFVSVSYSQTVSQKLQKAWQQFESDSQLKHAISSLYVIDAKTGQVVFDKNSQIGLAPASTQKIITAATAFELLGKDYRYKTKLGYEGKIEKDKLIGNIVVVGSGDPSFGSWRWNNTIEEKVIDEFVNEVKKLGINDITGSVVSYTENWETQHVPDGWIIQDIGNYYGAGVSSLNWRENQFDVYLKSGNKIGDTVSIVKFKPNMYNSGYVSEVTSAAKGTGDNAYIYTNPTVLRGTIPVNENMFKISGAMENGNYQFIKGLSDTLLNNGIDLNAPFFSRVNISLEGLKDLHTYFSPTLDSLLYWFLKKSINLYGEALIKTFAFEKNGFGNTNDGVKIVKDFWKQKGIDEDELNISDGSGLSPQNRVTTHAQVEVLKYAKTKDWFQYYLNGFPDYNGMTMKSGTIRDVKGFAGYHKAKDGKEYIFSFLVNNYSGRTSAVVSKMYKVLDELK